MSGGRAAAAVVAAVVAAFAVGFGIAYVAGSSSDGEGGETQAVTVGLSDRAGTVTGATSLTVPGVRSVPEVGALRSVPATTTARASSPGASESPTPTPAPAPEPTPAPTPDVEEGGN